MKKRIIERYGLTENQADLIIDGHFKLSVAYGSCMSIDRLIILLQNLSWEKEMNV